MGSPSDQEPERSVARVVADELGSAARRAAQPVVEDAVSTFSMLVLIVLLVPVGIVGLVVSFLLLAVLTKAVGLPSGLLGSIVGITWFAGTLVGLVFVFRTLYRRMPRRLRTAYAAPMEQEMPDPPASATAHLAGPARAAATAAAPAPTLAELDARLAQEQEPGPSASG
jgi:hypothetical protein